MQKNKQTNKQENKGENIRKKPPKIISFKKKKHTIKVNYDKLNFWVNYFFKTSLEFLLSIMKNFIQELLVYNYVIATFFLFAI